MISPTDTACRLLPTSPSARELRYPYQRAMRKLQDGTERRRTLATPLQLLRQAPISDTYMYGRGLPRDYAEAAKFYRKEAEGGDAGGMSHLGNLYQTGRGVPKSFRDAASNYQKAVDLHYEPAALYLGDLYQNRWGVQQDLDRARFLFSQASTSRKPQIASAATKLGAQAMGAGCGP
jgi:TPR repeat protein